MKNLIGTFIVYAIIATIHYFGGFEASIYSLYMLAAIVVVTLVKIENKLK